MTTTCGGYLRYIGTREGVELLPSGYAEYMAERPRSHGLFGDEANVDMDAVMKELNQYPGNIWTHIISLRREDAERLGYDHAAQWRNLLRVHRNEIAEAMHISPGDFRWYAAFHDEGDHPEVESLMMTLAAQLESVTGKKKYGYLPKTVKKTVDEIVNQMELLPVVNECYQVWWKLQCQIEDFYSERERRRPPLSERKEFRAIKNAVIQEAENIRMGTVTFEDSEIVDLPELSPNCWGLWMVTQDDTVQMADRDEAAAQLISKAESGDRCAQYLVGRLYQDGPVLIPNSVEAGYWFEQSARQGHVAAQYELGKLLLSDDLEVRDSKLGIQWLEYAAHNGSDCAAYRLGKAYLEGEIVERDTAKAVEFLTQSAEAGNQYAQYALGKLYLEQHDPEQAHYWFAQSATQGNEYAQFFLNRWDNLKPSSVMLSVTRLLHHMSRVFREQMPAPSVPGGIQIDRKRLQKLREKKIAMGHKADDHEWNVANPALQFKEKSLCFF